MAVTISKTKFIIFHNRGKVVDMKDINIVYDDNQPLSADPLLITPLERYHTSHERAFKLQGVHLDEHLNFNITTVLYVINCQDPSSVKDTCKNPLFSWCTTHT